MRSSTIPYVPPIEPWSAQPQQQQAQQTPPGPPTPGPPPSGPPPADEPKFTQADLSRIAAEEKRQGARQAETALAAELGYPSVEAMKSGVAAQQAAARQAETDLQRREREAAERETALAARESANAAEKRQLDIDRVLVGLGATGDNLTDARALLGGTLAADADADAIQAAATALHARRPGFFTATTAPPAPHTRTSQVAPGRVPPAGDRPGDAGRREAARRFPQVAGGGQ